MNLKKNNTGLKELLLKFFSKPDPILSMLNWCLSKKCPSFWRIKKYLLGFKRFLKPIDAVIISE